MEPHAVLPRLKKDVGLKLNALAHVSPIHQLQSHRRATLYASDREISRLRHAHVQVPSYPRTGLAGISSQDLRGDPLCNPHGSRCRLSSFDE